MICGSCGKKLSRLQRFLDRLRSGKIVYTIQVVEDNYVVTEVFPVCEECGKFYAWLEDAISMYGEDEVSKWIKKLNEEYRKKEE